MEFVNLPLDIRFGYLPYFLTVEDLTSYLSINRSTWITSKTLRDMSPIWRQVIFNTYGHRYDGPDPRGLVKLIKYQIRGHYCPNGIIDDIFKDIQILDPIINGCSVRIRKNRYSVGYRVDLNPEIEMWIKIELGTVEVRFLSDRFTVKINVRADSLDIKSIREIIDIYRNITLYDRINGDELTNILEKPFQDRFIQLNIHDRHKYKCFYHNRGKYEISINIEDMDGSYYS